MGTLLLIGVVGISGLAFSWEEVLQGVVIMLSWQNVISQMKGDTYSVNTYIFRIFVIVMDGIIIYFESWPWYNFDLNSFNEI